MPKLSQSGAEGWEDPRGDAGLQSVLEDCRSMADSSRHRIPLPSLGPLSVGATLGEGATSLGEGLLPWLILPGDTLTDPTRGVSLIPFQIQSSCPSRLVITPGPEDEVWKRRIGETLNRAFSSSGSQGVWLDWAGCLPACVQDLPWDHSVYPPALQLFSNQDGDVSDRSVLE